MCIFLPLIKAIAWLRSILSLFLEGIVMQMMDVANELVEGAKNNCPTILSYILPSWQDLNKNG
jgi:hypothetical protein